MEYRQDIAGGNHTITMTGRFTFADHGSFKKIVDTVRAGQMEALTFNMQGVEFIDSAALGMLLIVREEAQKHKFLVALSGAQGQVDKMFRVSKFETLFTLRQA